MALDLNLEGLTEEQLRGARQFQKQMQQARAARTAGVSAAAPAPQIMNTTAMSAARATAGPATGSTPTPTNIAPVATANAAAPGFGQRVLNWVKGGGKLFTAGAIGAVGAQSAMKTGATPTEDYERMFGFGPSNLDSPTARFVRDIGVRGLGALVDLGRTVNPFSGESTPSPAKPAAGGVAAAAPAAAPINAEALMRGTAVPARGTGAFRVGRRPAVAVDSRGAVVEEAAPRAQAAPTPASFTLPSMGTDGGIFENLVQFQRDAAVTAGGIAAARAAKNREAAQAASAAKGIELGIKAEEAVTGRMRAAAEAAKAGSEGKKVVTDLQGNPIVVDTKRATATKPRVNPQISAADIQTTAAKHNMTPQQVIARMLTEGRMAADDPLIARFAQ